MIAMPQFVIRDQLPNATLELVRGAHPWVGDAVFDHAPGHHGAVMRFLQALERIVGIDELPRRLRSLQTVYDADHRELVVIDIGDLAERRRDAVRQAVKDALDHARRHCAVCGVRIISGQGFCHPHRTALALFAGDEPVARARKSASVSTTGAAASTALASSVNGVGAAPSHAAARSGNGDQNHSSVGDDAAVAVDAVATGDICIELDPEELPEPAAPVPHVKVFDPLQIGVVERAAKGMEPDSEKRILALLGRLKTASACKPLACIAPGWEKALGDLKDAYPNFREFLDFLGDQCALAALGNRALAMPPVLFEGPPGIGKTDILLTLAEMLDTAHLMIDMASAQSGSALSGSDAFWSNSQEGDFFKVLAYGRTANPIVILDELDKVAGDKRYAPDGPLYQLLEERTARRFCDLSVRDLPLDARHVLWFATANHADRIDSAILSRFKVLKVPMLTTGQTVDLARRMYAKLVRDELWGTRFAPELPAAVAGLLARCSPRRIKPLLRQACGRAARAGRGEITPGDVPPMHAEPAPIGFGA